MDPTQLHSVWEVEEEADQGFEPDNSLNHNQKL